MTTYRPDRERDCRERQQTQVDGDVELKGSCQGLKTRGGECGGAYGLTIQR
jgi:hypothetical protein